MASDDRRLHPLSWIFTAAQFAKGFIIPVLLLLLASGGDGYELWGALFIGPVIAAAVLHHRVYRYRLAEDEIVVRDGLLTRTERHIPYGRIQNIDLVRNPLHRLCKVALVRVETASGTRPEAVMRVLSLDAVAEMHGRVFAGRPAARDANAAVVGRRGGGRGPAGSAGAAVRGGRADRSAGRCPRRAARARAAAGTGERAGEAGHRLEQGNGGGRSRPGPTRAGASRMGTPSSRCCGSPRTGCRSARRPTG